MTRTLIVSLLLLAMAAMAGCSGVTTPAHAQSSGGSFWSNGSGASIKGTFTTISAEANLDASNGLAKLDMPFQLPAGTSLTKLQATISYRAVSSGCSPQALMSIQIDGVDAYRAIVKTTAQATAVNLFINYDYPVPVESGQANLHVEADGNCKSNWEIQGVME
jgi:hypothetical protein